jgi:hypothetical protein
LFVGVIQVPQVPLEGLGSHQVPPGGTLVSFIMKNKVVFIKKQIFCRLFIIFSSIFFSFSFKETESLTEQAGEEIFLLR